MNYLQVINIILAILPSGYMHFFNERNESSEVFFGFLDKFVQTCTSIIFVLLCFVDCTLDNAGRDNASFIYMNEQIIGAEIITKYRYYSNYYDLHLSA